MTGIDIFHLILGVAFFVLITGVVIEIVRTLIEWRNRNG